MDLQEILSGVEVVEITGNSAIPISGLHYDSRHIAPGFLFVAIHGEKTDGNRFVPQALASGAAAVASELPPMAGTNCVWMRVHHARPALAVASANFYGRPARQLELIGITGTNGKTTTSFLLDSIFRAADKTTGLLGTIEYRIAGEKFPAPNTTPESLDLQAYLARLRAASGQCAIMEVSSHALAMDRVFGVPFAAAVFTNLTRDHLDFHSTMEAYFAEKRKLFTGLGARPPQWSILNADDEWSLRLRGAGAPNTLTYGFSADAQVRPVEWNTNSGRFRMDTPWGQVESCSSLLGRPNVYNLLAASATALALGVGREELERGLASLESVPGRFEQVHAGQPFLVVVDYAHTDDALRNLLATAHGLLRPGGRIITLFGCGGDRDRTKRPLMGEAAGSQSDLVVLTSDNPRSEDPLSIINDARVGVQKAGAKYHLEPDRAKAIALALGEARTSDIVLIAGKGHEDYQVIGDKKFPFDDRVIARDVLKRLGY